MHAHILTRTSSSFEDAKPYLRIHTWLNMPRVCIYSLIISRAKSSDCNGVIITVTCSSESSGFRFSPMSNYDKDGLE